MTKLSSRLSKHKKAWSRIGPSLNSSSYRLNYCEMAALNFLVSLEILREAVVRL